VRQRLLLTVKGTLSDAGSTSKIHQFSEAFQKAVMRQAIPALYQGLVTLFVTISAEMSRDSYEKAEPFYPLHVLPTTSRFSTTFVCAFDRALLYAGF
jgi:hypothetical protein